MQAQWSHCLRVLENMNALLGGPRVDGDVGDTLKHHQGVTTHWESLKNIVQITHEHGGQISAEDANSMLVQFLALLKYPELSITGHSKGFSRGGQRVCLLGAPNRRSKSGVMTWSFRGCYSLQLATFSPEQEILPRRKRGSLLSRISFSSVYHLVEEQMLRFVLESMASTKLTEDAASSRFYAAVLRCAHLVLSDCKGSVEEHIPGFVGALRVFFTYGLVSSSSSLLLSKGGQGSAAVGKPSSWQETGPKVQERGAYRPPHLRGKPQASRSNKVGSSEGFVGDYDGQGGWGGVSSDSEQSDSDAHYEEGDRFKSSKVRTNAILSIQAIARADPKILHAHWVVLLPTQDVLQPRPYQTTLLTVLLNDPIMKARMAAASTLAVMLEGPARAFLQVAEHREIARSKSFTTLSSSLGQLVIQLHIGLLHVISNEPHGGLVVGALKALSLLVSASPYSRLPQELLPWTICTVHRRCAAINCLGAAFSSTPASAQVAAILDVQEPPVSSSWAPSVEGPSCSHLLLQDLVIYAQLSAYPVVRVEAFQTLKAAVHSYPSILHLHWEPISKSIMATIDHANCYGGSGEPGDAYLRQMLASTGNGLTGRVADDKVVHSAIKLLDEFLRAVSGYKGNDESIEDGPFQTPSPFLVPKPLRLVSGPVLSVSKHLAESLQSEIDGGAGVKLWLEALNKHLPSTLSHSAPMVRGAALTCFAGLTSAVFCLLPADKQHYVLSALIYAAWKDDTPAVRSAACRAIGVVVGFPQVAESEANLERAVDVVVSSTIDSSVSVRITASWALANICDALRSVAEKKDEVGRRSPCLAHLAECALRAAKDCDKVRANAVRALGNLARFADFRDQTEGKPITCWQTSHLKCLPTGDILYQQNLGLNRDAAYQGAVEARRWLGVMVQTLVSCVTTGNVKVQWNVCHALGNLFLNKTINLSSTAWVPSVYSILLLLLRDSANYKIRIHAASALAVPGDREDYGESFTDVVKALVYALESTDSEHEPAPSSGFKYVKALTEQLSTTVVHVLGLSKPEDFIYLKDLLLKKSVFMLDFFSSLCSSIGSSVMRDAYLDETGVLDRMTEVSVSQIADSKGVAYDEKPLPPPKENRRYGLQMDDTTLNGGIAHKVEDLQKAVRAVASMYRYGDIATGAQSWVSLLAEASESFQLAAPSNRSNPCK